VNYISHIHQGAFQAVAGALTCANYSVWPFFGTQRGLKCPLAQLAYDQYDYESELELLLISLKV
jgi:hypothetical protein